MVDSYSPIRSDEASKKIRADARVCASSPLAFALRTDMLGCDTPPRGFPARPCMAPSKRSHVKPCRKKAQKSRVCVQSCLESARKTKKNTRQPHKGGRITGNRRESASRNNSRDEETHEGSNYGQVMLNGSAVYHARDYLVSGYTRHFQLFTKPDLDAARTQQLVMYVAPYMRPARLFPEKRRHASDCSRDERDLAPINPFFGTWEGKSAEHKLRFQHRLRTRSK